MTSRKRSAPKPRSIVESMPNIRWTCLYSTGRKSKKTMLADNVIVAEWAKFYQTWWSQPARFANKPVLRVEQSKTWNKFGLLGASEGHIVVREEYNTLYQRISELPQKTKGALVTGQPGIGKSYFGIYAVLRRMVQNEKVIFTSSDGVTCLIDELGVWSCVAQKGMDWPFPKEERVWSIVDLGHQTEPLKLSLLNVDCLLGIVLSPPAKREYTDFIRLSTTTRMILNPWNMAELHLLFSDLKYIPLGKVAKGVEEVVAAVGPCPRDMFDHLRSGKDLERDIAKAISQVPSLTALRAILKGEGDAYSTSHCIIIVRRSEDTDNVEYEQFEVDFKTDGIREALSEHLLNCIIHSATHTTTYRALIGPDGSSSHTGRLYEMLVHWSICGEKLEGNVGAIWFAPMRMESSTTFPHIFKCRDKSATFKGELTIDGRRRAKFQPLDAKESRPISSLDQGQELDRLFNRTLRKREVYDDINNISFSVHQYYILRSPTNPLFDSFLLEEKGSSIVLWFIQVTIPRKHKWSTQDVSILTTIIAKAKEKFPDKVVETKYALIVPRLRGLQTTWTVPVEEEEWKSVAGPIYLQPLETDILSFKAIFPREQSI